MEDFGLENRQTRGYVEPYSCFGSVCVRFEHESRPFALFQYGFHMSILFHLTTDATLFALHGAVECIDTSA